MSARPKYAWESKAIQPFGVVQNYTQAHNNTDGTSVEMRLGLPPTKNNLLISSLMLSTTNGAPSPLAGWTNIASVSSANTLMWIAIYAKYAGVAEPQNQQIDQSGRNGWSMNVWEIFGVSGILATDIKATHINAELAIFPNNTPPPLNTTLFNTATKQELILLGLHGNAAAQSLLSSSVGIADSAAVCDPNSLDMARAYHDTKVAAGTPWQAAISWTSQSSIEYAAIELAH